MSNVARAAIVIAVMGSSVHANVYVDPNARLIACYQEVIVPAEYYVTKELIQAAEQKYIRRNNRIELIENPAIYKEHRTLKSPRHTVLEEIPCD